MSGDAPNNERLEPRDTSGATAQDSGQSPPQVPRSKSNPPSPPNGGTKAHKPDRDWLDYVKFAVELVGLGFLIAYTVYAGLSWREMRRTTKASQDQLALMRDADRPWVDVDVSVSSPLTYDKNGIHVTFNFVPTNIGRSPAQSIWINPTLRPDSMGDDMTEIQKHICEVSANHGADLTYVLFPGNHYTQQIGMRMSIEDINSRWNKFELSRGPIDFIPMVLVGCVDYTYESSPKHHQTGFAFDVLTKDRLIISKSKTPLDSDSLILMPHPFGGHFAN